MLTEVVSSKNMPSSYLEAQEAATKSAKCQVNVAGVGSSWAGPIELVSAEEPEGNLGLR